MAWLNYLFEVSVCITIFYIFYKGVLSRFSFYHFNRIYLLITFMASFAIPAVSIKIQQKQLIWHVVTKSDQLKSTPVTFEEHAGNIDTIETINWDKIIVTLYSSVSFILLIIFLWQLISLLISCCRHKQKVDGLLLIEKSSGQVNYSFFHYVFIDRKSIDSQALQLFLKHEKFHASQLHSLDCLLISIGKIVLWFHPVIYLYSAELSLQHEFEADAFVSADYGKKRYAEVLLHTAMKQSGLFNLANAFAKKPINTRIQKIFLKPTLNMKKSFYVSVLPVIIMLCWMYSFDSIYTTSPSGKKFTLVIDAGHGGSDWGAKANGVYEKDITLSFSNLLADKLRKNDIEVILTRTNDEAVSLKNRIANKSDFFLSFHVNSTQGSKAANGISMLIPAWNMEQKLGSKILRSIDMSKTINASFENIQGIRIDSNIYHNQRLYALENISSPGLYLELGFIDNSKDFKYIMSKEGKEEITDALTNAVLNYRNNHVSSH